MLNSVKGSFCPARPAALAAALLLAAFTFVLPGGHLMAEEQAGGSALTPGKWFLDRFYWGFGGAVLFFPEDNGMKGDPMPILPAPFLMAGFNARGPFSVETTLDVYTTHYGYDFGLARAIPYAIENRSARVWGFLAGFNGVYRFTLPDGIRLRVYSGPAFDFRAAVVAEDLNSADFSGDDRDAGRQTDAVRSYFWEKGRWIFAAAGTGADFPLPIDIPLLGKVLLGVDSRVWFPVYRIWSGEDLPPIEGWRFGFNIRVTFPEGGTRR